MFIFSDMSNYVYKMRDVMKVDVYPENETPMSSQCAYACISYENDMKVVVYHENEPSMLS